MKHTKFWILVGSAVVPLASLELAASQPEFEPELMSLAAPGTAGSQIFRDVNGDGVLDMLYRAGEGFVDNDFVVSFGNADGGYTPARSSGVTGSIRTFGPDLNMNGQPEIITTVDGSVAVYEINTSGEVVPVAFAAVPSTGFPSNFSYLRNLDGSQDILVKVQSPIRFFLIRTEPGGAFQLPVELPQLADLWLESNQVIDVNGDGASDIVGIGVDATQLLVFGSTPSGEFAEAVVSPLPPLMGPTEFRQVYGGFDWNGDGIPDLLLSRLWQVGWPLLRVRFEILTGSPDGRFEVDGPVWERDIGENDSLGQSIFPGQSGEVCFLQTLRTASPDGDPAVTSYEFVAVTAAGDLDIKPVPAEFGLFRGWTASWGTPGPVMFGSRMVSTEPLEADFTIMTLGQPQSLQTVLTDVRVKTTDPVATYVDLDGDGVIELLVAAPDRVTIFRNTGTPSDPVFLQNPELPFSSIGAIAPADGTDGELIAVGAGEAPGTGLAALLRRAAGEAMEVVTSTPLPGPGRAMTVLEEGPDGLRLAVVYDASPVDRLLIMTFSDSAGFTVVSDSELTTSLISTMASGDLDADGFVDIVLTDDRRDQNILGGVLWGGPDGSFGSSAVLQAQGSRRGLAVELMDLNQDGLLDIVIGCGTGIKVRAWTVGSDRTLTPAPTTDATGTSLGGMVAGDFDQDGLQDIAFANGTSLVMLRGDGVGSFAPSFDVDLGAPIASLARVQGTPGQPDIIAVAFENHNVRMYDGSGIEVGDRVYATSAAPDALRVIDLDGDHAPELITASRSGYVSVLAGIPDSCPADLAEPFGTLNFFDLAAYIGLFNAGSPDADLAAPFGELNFFDVAAYLGLYNAGCP